MRGLGAWGQIPNISYTDHQGPKGAISVFPLSPYCALFLTIRRFLLFLLEACYSTLEVVGSGTGSISSRKVRQVAEDAPRRKHKYNYVEQTFSKNKEDTDCIKL